MGLLHKLTVLILCLPLICLGNALGSVPRQVRAQAIAVRYWGHTLCQDRITLSYQPLARFTLAEARYSYYVDTPSAYESCSVVFNSDRKLSWPLYCATMVHEYGHLDGHHHSMNPRNVMYPLITAENIPSVCVKK